MLFGFPYERSYGFPVNVEFFQHRPVCTLEPPLAPSSAFQYLRIASRHHCGLLTTFSCADLSLGAYVFLNHVVASQISVVLLGLFR